MAGYWNAHSDRDWENECGNPLPARPQFPVSYAWHLGPIYNDINALQDRAELLEIECDALNAAMIEADDRGDAAECDRFQEEFALVDHELSQLNKRIEELE